MSYTQADLDAIDEAIKRVTSGGIAEIELDGERTVYTKLTDLLKARNMIAACVLTSTNDSYDIKVRFKNVE